MADSFDPYRESLIMETDTVWPSDFDHLSPAAKAKLEQSLHAAPDQCAHLEYVRVHTGFCRKIVVTESDVARLGA